MIITWAQLRAMREAGQRPGLPVIVTLDRRDAFRIFTAAFAVVVHQPGTPMPLELLDGLAVLLRMPCEYASRVARALRSRGVKPAHCESWCACRASLTVTPDASCEDARAIEREWSAAEGVAHVPA